MKTYGTTVFRKFVLPFLLGVLLGGAFIAVYARTPQGNKFLSPLSLNQEVMTPHVPSDKKVTGFLPYWTLSKADIPYHLLDYIAYFAVSFNPDGTIKTKEKNYTEPGWYKLQSSELKEIFSKAEEQGVGKMLVFTAFQNSLIDSLVLNPESSKQAIESIVRLVEEYDLDAVNIDFEYNGASKASPKSPAAYPVFIANLKERLQTVDREVVVSVDLYANGFIVNHPYDAVKLAEVADELIMMGYDFHQAASSKAGPVAPLKCDYGRSITEALNAAITRGIPTEKITLAMPFYGYEWRTTNANFRSPTYPGTGAMASYQKVRDLITKENIQPQWDYQAMSPWLSYTKNGTTRQIYYENDQSIGLKLELIKQTDLKGTAIWALGYEGNEAPVWKVIENWRRGNV